MDFVPTLFICQFPLQYYGYYIYDISIWISYYLSMYDISITVNTEITNYHMYVHCTILHVIIIKIEIIS